METKTHTAGVTLFEIEQEVHNLSLLWELYSQIYRKKHEKPLPFSVAPVFFRSLNGALQENIIATIVRLFDSSFFNERSSSANIGYSFLIDQLIDEEYPEEDINMLMEKVNSFKKQYKTTIFFYRNKRLGHNDYDTIRDDCNMEPIFTVPHLIEAVGNIYELTNNFEDLLMKKKMSPENDQDFYAHPQRSDFSHTNADADKLIEAINQALS